jgi:hypothetical protein
LSASNAIDNSDHNLNSHGRLGAYGAAVHARA